MNQPEYTVELTAPDLYTLEQLCKSLRDLGSLDWQELEELATPYHRYSEGE